MLTRLNSHPPLLNDIKFRRWIARVEDGLARFECARGDLWSGQDTEVDTIGVICKNAGSIPRRIATDGKIVEDRAR